MKPYHFFVAAILLLLATSSCKKHHDKPATKYPSPTWKTDTSSLYPYTMTAVIQLPDELQKDGSTGDKMAAFAGDDCRGVGVVVTRDTLPAVYYLLIRGSASEQVTIKLRYYNAKNSYLYTTSDSITFTIDDIYGTVDAPVIPGFNVEK